MSNIVVLVKQVPDTWSERKLNESDYTLDRESADAVLDEICENAVEAALQIKEAGGDYTVTVLAVGPERATEALRKALSLGCDEAIHVVDDALAGSDVLGTAWTLSQAINLVDDVELIITGNASTDGTAETLRAQGEDVVTVTARTNTGGAGGFAIGIRRALELGCDAVWLMDDDTVPEPEALSALVRARDEFPLGTPAVVASRVVWTDGRDHPMNTPRPSPFASAREREAAASIGCVPVRSASGSAARPRTPTAWRTARSSETAGRSEPPTSLRRFDSTTAFSWPPPA